MDPHLKTLQEELAAIIADLTAEQMQRRMPGKWCVAEVLEHLYLTYTGTTKGFQTRARNSEGDYNARDVDPT